MDTQLPYEINTSSNYICSPKLKLPVLTVDRFLTIVTHENEF
jgi:hypothetical protein